MPMGNRGLAPTKRLTPPSATRVQPMKRWEVSCRRGVRARRQGRVQAHGAAAGADRAGRTLLRGYARRLRLLLPHQVLREAEPFQLLPRVRERRRRDPPHEHPRHAQAGPLHRDDEARRSRASRAFSAFFSRP